MEIFDAKYLVQSLIVLLKYAHITLSIAILSMIIAVLFGVILAVIRMYKVKVLHSISEIYISFFRGTPILIQLFCSTMVCLKLFRLLKKSQHIWQ